MMLHVQRHPCIITECMLPRLMICLLHTGLLCDRVAKTRIERLAIRVVHYPRDP